MIVKALLVVGISLPSVTQAGGLDSLFDKMQLALSTSVAPAAECMDLPFIDTDILIQDASMTTIKPSGNAYTPRFAGTLQGMAHVTYGFEVDFTLDRFRFEGGFCVRLSRIVVKTGHVAPEIWIRPGLVTGTCRYDTTLEHEKEHVGNYHEHLRAFEAQVTRVLPRALAGASYYTIISMDESRRAEEQLKDEVVELLTAMHEVSYRVAEGKDMLMDLPSEYSRLSNACN